MTTEPPQGLRATAGNTVLEFAPHPSTADRVAVGKAARKAVSRKRQAQWQPATDRPDPIALLEEQERTRMPGLLPLRHERMGVSAFTFYRGTAIIMASDLASQPNSGLEVQLCGDAHLSNFGLFAAPDRQPVFDLNDFDETNPGPFEWDVKRLAVSFILAARDNKLPKAVGLLAARSAAQEYRRSMWEYAQMPEIDIWYARIDAAYVDAWRKSRGADGGNITFGDGVKKARARTMWTAVDKLTELVDGRRLFLNQPPVLVRVPEGTASRQMMLEVLPDYLDTLAPDRRALLNRYEIVDFGHKVVGVGSVGLLAWVLLLQGRDDKDLLVLQLKQAQRSVLEPYTEPSTFEQHGERVVQGQRLIQAASDSFLGWCTGKLGRQYYVRQLRDMKWSPDPAALDPEGLINFARLCGHTLGRAHARSGDAVALSAYMGQSNTFEAAIEEFSAAYAETVEQDFAAFRAAVDSGRLVSGDPGRTLEQMYAAMQNPAALAIPVE